MLIFLHLKCIIDTTGVIMTDVTLVLAKPDYTKMRISLLWGLQGKGMTLALTAMLFAEDYSRGNTRKDGITPEFEHQVRQALFALLLKDISDIKLELLICVTLLHDVMEDYDVELQTLVNLLDGAALQNPKYAGLGSLGAIVAASVWAMTKTYKGKKKSPDSVFADIANDELASLAKGLDRMNNFQTMVGTFNLPKRISYVQEGLKYFLPMLKAARRKFVHHTYAYLNIETVIKYQIELLQVINDQAYLEDINSVHLQGAKP